MKTLYLDCGMGAAGDMLAGALMELLPEAESFVAELNGLGIPGVEFVRERAVKCGIIGTHISVRVNGAEEGAEHHHGHGHTAAGHHHGSMADIAAVMESLALPKKVKRDVMTVYRLIAEAESHVHGVPVEAIHFHEVGTMDAIADITAVCLLMERLSPEQVVVSPVHVGSGHVRCAHGILPVPAPATAYLLRDKPIFGGTVEGELCTPTGAALLQYFATEFGALPVMRISAIGYGMGKKDFAQANCVRALLGEAGDETGVICELSCNVDDMTGEAIGFAMDRVFEAGALEAYTIPIGMKKSRPGVLLRVQCRLSERETIVRNLFRYTTTIGIRENVCCRYELARSEAEVNTPLGPVRRKTSFGYGVSRVKWEYEDLARIARERGLCLEKAGALVEHAVETGRNDP